MSHKTEKLLSLTPIDFARLGADSLAYVKPGEVEGEPCFVLHAADGTVLWHAKTREIAMAAARQNNLNPLSVN